QDHRPGNSELPGSGRADHGRRAEAAHQGGARRHAEERRREVRGVPRGPVRVRPCGACDPVAPDRRRVEVALRDAALAEGARDASPGAADDDPADDRPGAASDPPDAGADGADAAAGAAGRSAVTLLLAAAISVAAAAGALQTSAPALSHEYADVNGVKL